MDFKAILGKQDRLAIPRYLGLLFFLVISLRVIYVGCAYYWYGFRVPLPQGSATAVAVLFADGTIDELGPVTKRRLREAISLTNSENSKKKLYLLGGLRQERENHCAAAREFIYDLDASAEFTCLGLSYSTASNLRELEVVPQMSIEKFTILTSTEHAPRVKYLYQLQHRKCESKVAGVYGVGASTFLGKIHELTALAWHALTFEWGDRVVGYLRTGSFREVGHQER